MCGCPFYIGFIGYLLSFYWICDVVDFEIHQHFMYIYMRKFCQLNWLTISEKVGLKLNIQKTKIMASGPITPWEIDGETVETVSDFIFWGSKIASDGDCSHEIKRRLLLGRKVMTNLDSIFKSRGITLPTKVRLIKAMVFQWSCMDVRVRPWRRLSAEELMLLNCGVGEDSWESLGLQGKTTSPF